MAILSRAADTAYAFRFLKLFVTPFDKTKAFELGIIDEKGKGLKKVRDFNTSEERSAYTVFHRLVFNLKKLLEKIPGGRSRLASYAAALYLIKEKDELNDETIDLILNKISEELELDESREYLSDFEELNPGRYILKQDLAHFETGEELFKKGDIILNDDLQTPVDRLAGINIFTAIHEKTKQKVYFTHSNIER
tara:strand:+ start:130 stop:711 length:582 start_codon:yes stop_codon:yes gene_type:complete